MNQRLLKAQSAMEYLMTYGWAILIISVVLGALFSIGVFSGGALLGTSCIAASGFYCSSVSLSHTSGLVTATIGQDTGTNWGAYQFVFVPQGWTTINGIPLVPINSFLSSTASINGISFPNGAQVTLSFNVLQPGAISAWPATSYPVGATLAGSIWACYGSGSTGPAYYISGNAVTFNGIAACTSYLQVATLTVKAT